MSSSDAGPAPNHFNNLLKKIAGSSRKFVKTCNRLKSNFKHPSGLLSVLLRSIHVSKHAHKFYLWIPFLGFLGAKWWMQHNVFHVFPCLKEGVSSLAKLVVFISSFEIMIFLLCLRTLSIQDNVVIISRLLCILSSIKQLQKVA